MTFVQEPKADEPKTGSEALVQTVADYPIAEPKKLDGRVGQPSPSPKGRGWLAWLLVLVLLCGGGAWAAYHYNLFRFGSTPDAAAKKGRGAIPVVTATARKGDLSLYLSEIGTVTAFQTVTVRSRVDGELMKVNFTEGQVVQEKDPLVEIDPRPYEVQLAQAEGQLARDQATMRQARLDLARDRQLAAAKALTAQTLDAQVATLGQYEGAIKTDQAMIDNAKLQIIYCNITAPISGRLGLRLIDKGNFVQASNPSGLAVITQLQPIAVIFAIPQDEIFRVQQKFKTGEDVVVEAWNRDLRAKLATGRLLAIDNQVDTTTGTVKLKAAFPNEDNLLFPNEFVNAKLLIEVRKGAVIVPAAAIQRGPNSTFAYVVKPDETVDMRTVEIGPTEGDQTIVESGLSPGDVVVTDGTDKLQPNAKVDTRSSKTGGKSKGGPAKTDKKSAAADAKKATPAEAAKKPEPAEAGKDGSKAE
jgi:membrane fusion protein, multidrug efflux system